jgi:GDP/UDP-N,N'-diacetylbacillosamine 2-epimerase (hydrolysing)
MKILALTGIRSEYDILFPLINAFKNKYGWDVKLALSGAHLSDWHGNSQARIKDDGFEVVDRIDSLFSTNRETQRIKGIGVMLYGLSQTVEREHPDVLLVVGDREESIAAALVGNYMGVLTAHLGGGDPVWGNSDDPIRMAVSKLAHIHLVTANTYGQNLVNSLHEDEFRVHFIGNPANENIKKEKCIDLNELSDYLKFDIRNGRYLVLIKHPLSIEAISAGEQYAKLLNALKMFCSKHNYKVVASYPNTDPGSYEILNVIENFKNEDWICFNKTLPRTEFVNLLRHSKVLVGNSSLGLLEAPYYKLPVVNVGNRQRGRLNAGNVEYVGYEQSEIEKAVFKAAESADYRAYIGALVNPFENEEGDPSDLAAKALLDSVNRREEYLVKRNLC